MSEAIVVPGVILSGDDLNFPQSPWRRVTRANNRRLVPIVLGFVLSLVSLRFLVDTSLVQIVALVLPIALGYIAFIYLWSAVLSEYRRAYGETPTGAAPCTFTFDADGMKQVGLRYESKFGWETFVEVVETNEAFRFWMTPFVGVVLPLRYLTEGQVEALRRLVANARSEGHIQGLRD